MENVIYMDHAATTPADPRVVEAMLPWFTEQFGNPATLYTCGGEAEASVEEARARVARHLNAEP